MELEGLKRTRADRRRAALKGWRTRRANERSAAAKRGWQTRKKNEQRISKKHRKPARRSVPERLPSRSRTRSKGFRKRSEAAKKGWKRRRRNQKALQRQTAQRREAFQPQREYFVVLTFTTRKRGRTVTRRLYEAIVTLPDGATEDEVLKAYQEKIQEQNPKLHNREIERLLFGENRGRRIKIVPRDSPGSEVASGSVRVNDARNPAKRKSATGRKRKGKKT